MSPKALPWGSPLMTDAQSDNAEWQVVVAFCSTGNLLPIVITNH